MYLSRDSGATFLNVNTNTPYAYFPFDGNLTDSKGNVTLTTTGSVSYVTGIVGANAINISNTVGGTATNYLSGSITPGNNFSVSLWFNLQSLPTTNATQSNIISFGTSSQLIFQIMYLNLTGYTGFYVQYYDGTSISTSILGGYTSVNTNTWYNITCTFQVTGRNIVYINNTLVANVASSGISAAITTMRLGYGIGNTTSAFNGCIDDLKIYNSAIGFTPMVPMNYSYSAVSGTGQYMACAVASGGLFLSSNYGSTWSQVTSVIGTGAWSSLALSHTGQYMLANGGGMTSPNMTGLTGSTSVSNATTSWTVNGVTWTSSASSVFNSGGSMYNAWIAFNNIYNTGVYPYSYASPANYNSSGVYNNTYNTTILGGVGTQYGEWLQLQSSIPLAMYSYAFAAGGSAFNIPKTYYIVGSNDGSNWYPIQYVSINTNPCTTNVNSRTSFVTVNQGTQSITADVSSTFTITTYSTTTNSYTYFRIIALSTFTGTSFELNEWYINFVGGQSYSTNYGVNWTNSLNTYVPTLNGLTTSSWQTPNGVTWTASASSAYSGTTPAYNAFNNVIASNNTWASGGTYNTSGSYTGSVSTTILGGVGSKNGEWLQIQSSVPLAMYSFTYSCESSYSTPYTYYLVGSNDGSNWYPIQSGAYSSTNPFTSGATYGTISPYILINYNGSQSITSPVATTLTTTAYSTSTNAYTYFRLIVPSMWNSTPVTAMVLSELYINFVGGTSTQINSTIATPNCLALSANGQYAIGANLQAASLISNYLGGFATNSSTALTLSGITANIVAAACSNTGAVMVLVTSGTTNNVYYSLNYGSTWSALTIGTVALTGCAVNYDGSYITVSNATNIYTLNSNTIGNSVALGVNAGQTNQGSNTIAIGSSAGQTNQTANSIILNASGSALNSYTSGFYVAPIANALASTSQQFSLLGYGADNQVVQSGLTFTNTPIGQIYGEYVQIQLVTPSSITSYAFGVRYGSSTAPLAYANRIPASLAIVGSNDGVNWTVLDTQSNISVPTSTIISFTLKTASAVYTYYRMIFTQLHSSSFAYDNYYHLDIGGFILYNNSNPLFGKSASYTVTGNNNGTLQLNSVTVCIVSWSTTSVYGISYYTTYYGYLVTSDGYLNTGGSYWSGFTIGSSNIGSGANCEYNSSLIAFQGTVTPTISSISTLTSILTSTSSIGIGTTAPAATLDVYGPISRNGLKLPRVDYGVSSGSSITIPILFSDSQYNTVEIRFTYSHTIACHVYLSANDSSGAIENINENIYSNTYTSNSGTLSGPTYSSPYSTQSLTISANGNIDGTSGKNTITLTISRPSYVSTSVRALYYFNHLWTYSSLGRSRTEGTGYLQSSSGSGLTPLGSITFTADANSVMTGNWNTTHYN